MSLSQIQENFRMLREEIPPDVALVVVSKTQAPETIREVYDTGHRVFGENRVQELVTKYPHLPPDIEWHFIGHLQRNKVKYIAPFIRMIQTIDSLKLLLEVNMEAGKANRTIDCLLQFHIASEESKFGLDWGEAVEMLESSILHDMKFIRICGVMGMATFTNNRQLISAEFHQLATFFHQLKEIYFSGSQYFTEISMGMSDDYPLAINQGSTIVRIGTKVFGVRGSSM